MDQTMLLLGQTLSLSAKVTGVLFLAYIYWKHRRESAFWWSLSWVAAASSIFADISENIYLLSVAEAFWAALLFCGTLCLLEENGVVSRRIKVISAIPVVTSLYGILIGVLGYSSDWFTLLGLPYAVSALFITISGLVILSLKDFYNKSALHLGGVITVLGLHELDFPILRLVEWFAPIGFVLGSVLAILSAYFMIKFVFTEEFIKVEKPPVEINFTPGVMMVSPEDYSKIKEMLKEVPALAFVRDLNVPEAWNAFFITNTGKGSSSIPPTNLARILDMATRYLREANEKGVTGVIVVDCPEYLKAYNRFETLAKFLASLKDSAVLHNGVLVLITDEGAWEKREFEMLKRILR
ncbi:MAG: DUF835 domain-containing protein [Thermococcus sp.]|nr:DUF835 domain-containing protein [Thermococcus sp.]